MTKSPHLSIRALIVRSVVLTILLFFWHVNGMGADFADRHLRLYLSVGCKVSSSVSIKDEMRSASYKNLSMASGFPTIGIGDATLLYSVNPKLSIGIQYWITRTPTFNGQKTVPLIFYAYDEGGIDTTTYTMEMQGREDFFVNVVGPAIQWTLISSESKQLYIRGVVGISIYSSYVERFAKWSSGGTPDFSILAFEKESPNSNAFGGALTLGGDVHARWISLGLEAAVRYTQPKKIEIPQKPADWVIAGGFSVKPEEGGITMPIEKRKLSFWGVSLGVVLGFHAF